MAGLDDDASQASVSRMRPMAEAGQGGPSNDSEPKIDPRTHLQIIQLPPEFQRIFPLVSGAIVHWVSRVRKYNRSRHRQNRIVLVSDAAIYVTWDTGMLTRIIPVNKIEKVVAAENGLVCFKVRGVDEFDMVIEVPPGLVQAPAGLQTTNQRYLLEVLRRIYHANTGSSLNYVQCDGYQDFWVKAKPELVRPDGWKLQQKPIKTIRSLTHGLEHRRNRREEEKRSVREEFLHIQEGLREELNTYREREYARVKGELDIMTALVAERDRELAQLRIAGGAAFCANCKEREQQEAERIVILERDLAEKSRLLAEMAAVGGPSSGDLRKDLAAKRDKILAQKRDLSEVARDFDMANRKLKELQESSSQEIAMLKKQLADAQLDLRKQALLSQPLPSEVNMRQQLAETESVIGKLRRELSMCDGKIRGESAAALQASKDENARLADELRRTKNVMKEAFNRQVDELEAIRRNFQKYDDQIVAYLERVFASNPGALSVPPPTRPSIPSLQDSLAAMSSSLGANPYAAAALAKAR